MDRSGGKQIKQYKRRRGVQNREIHCLQVFAQLRIRITLSMRIADPDQAVRVEPDQAVHVDQDQAVRVDPDQAVRVDPDQAVHADPDQAVHAEVDPDFC